MYEIIDKSIPPLNMKAIGTLDLKVLELLSLFSS